ncbi:MAG: NDP-sugar synthase [Thermoleophilia bacterium]|nr:NDP-sugar synthase [Thermoleophilia bacterium]
MQAVILSGGEGTRLRPLTSTMPKPSVPLVNRPMISYMIDWLAGHGVRDIVMSVGFLADGLRAALDDTGHAGVMIRYVEESQPLGTAGAVKHAEQFLDQRFLVLNGDVLTAFDISAEIEQHAATGARATLALVPVDDPTAYGLVLTGEDNRIETFLEKPSAEDVPPDPRINAGAYVLERDVLDMIEPEVNCSFEHDVFPHLASDEIYAYNADGYWLDLGTPERYLTATRDLLDRRLDSWVAERLVTGGVVIEPGVNIAASRLDPPVVIGDSCAIGSGSHIGIYSVLGHGCILGANCKLDRAVLQRGCTLGAGVSVTNSIVGPGVLIGEGAVIGTGSVIGEGASVPPGAHVPPGGRIEAGAEFTADQSAK